MEFSSKLIEKAVLETAKLPGIGKKTALRLVLHLLKQDSAQTTALTEALSDLRENIQYCKTCHNISDEDECGICLSSRRDSSIICIVEDSPDILSIENTAQYQGLYHVLGGLIAPIDGIGPQDLKIDSLLSRLSNSEQTTEILLALSPTMEGDTTAFYICKKLRQFPHLKISSIARGIPIGGELEYADEVTLGRSIVNRRRYDTETHEN